LPFCKTLGPGGIIPGPGPLTFVSL